MRRGRLGGVLAPGMLLLSAGSAAASVLPVGTWSFNEGQGSVAHDTSLAPVNGMLQGDAGSSVWDGNWHSVVGTFNGSEVDLYVDEVHVFNRARGSQEIHLGYVASQYLPQQFPDDAML